MMKKIAALFLSFSLAFAMIGCDFFEDDDDPHKYTKYTNEEIKALRDIEVEVYYYNWGAKVQEEEKVYFTYDRTAYNAVNIPRNGIYRTIIKDIPGYIMSSYLNKKITIPDVKEGEKLIVEIDYDEKTLIAHGEPIGENTTETQTEPENSEKEYYELKFNYLNSTNEIQKKENITVFYDDGTRYCFIYVDMDLGFRIEKINGYIYSEYLDSKVDIPDMKDGDILVIDVDYKEKTITSHIEKE